ncbi:bifunctional hydroxymethylpyrimidine kinase/phosphomethylpyrimidine kinase [Mariniluteicoccus flavus]
MTPAYAGPGRPPIALTIAGSDPSGGAGIQADLKTFSALGAFGTSVITALTAQATTGVTGVHEVPVDFVREQVETLVADVTIDVVKVGMLSSAALVAVVREALEGPLAGVPVVLDPVMVSTSGSRLLADDAVGALRELIPRADVLTPNLPEAAVLLGVDLAGDEATMRTQAESLCAWGTRRVLLKGGHLDGPDAVDLWWSPEDGPVTLRTPRVATAHTHGTGCTLSSAIAALRPRHEAWLPAVHEAKAWLTEALRQANELRVGRGPGPVHHFHELERWR